MKTGDLAKLFGVDPETVRDWTRRFSDLLSPKGGIHRVYDEEDVKVLATVAKLRSDGYGFAYITEKLAEGFRVEHPGVANYGVDTRMVPAAAVEQIVDSTELRIELEQVRADRDKLVELLENQKRDYEKSIQEIKAEQKAIRDEMDARHEKERQELQTRIDALQAQVIELSKQAIRAETRLEIMQEQKQEKPNNG